MDVYDDTLRNIIEEMKHIDMRYTNNTVVCVSSIIDNSWTKNEDFSGLVGRDMGISTTGILEPIVHEELSFDAGDILYELTNDYDKRLLNNDHSSTNMHLTSRFGQSTMETTSLLGR